MPTISLLVALAAPAAASATDVSDSPARNILVSVCPQELAAFEATVAPDDLKQFWRQTEQSSDPAKASMVQTAALDSVLADKLAIYFVGYAAKSDRQYLPQAIDRAAKTTRLVECLVDAPEKLDMGALNALTMWIMCLRPVHQAMAQLGDEQGLSGDDFDRIIVTAGSGHDCGKVLQ